MNINKPSFKPFEFDSPVEFILIGVVGKRRTVVAKSKGAQLDLIAYAEGKLDDYEVRPYLFAFPFSTVLRTQLRPFSVNSPPAKFPSNNLNDDRASECTLVWRGYGRERDILRIKDEFQHRIVDIVYALEEDSADRLEWAMSYVIDLCHIAIINYRSKRLRSVYSFSFVLLVYALVGVGFIFALITKLN